MPSENIWDYFYENFDEVMETCEIPPEKIPWIRDWKDGKMTQIQISETYEIELPKVRESIMLVFVRLRKHLDIPKTL